MIRAMIFEPDDGFARSGPQVSDGPECRKGKTFDCTSYKCLNVMNSSGIAPHILTCQWTISILIKHSLKPQIGSLILLPDGVVII